MFNAQSDIINASSMSFFGVYSDDDYHAVISSVYNSFDVQEKLRADFALLLLTDEAILINQKNMRKITEEANWQFDGQKKFKSDERVYFPTEILWKRS